MPQTSDTVASSDQGLIELLRQRGELGITELARLMNVTATAVRQRLKSTDGRRPDSTQYNQTTTWTP